jgi:Putative zinc-finger
MRAEPICADVRPELSARLDGELDAAALERVESHLSTCPHCRRYESELKAARRAVRVQPVGPVPDLTDSIMARVRALGPSSRRRDDLRAHLRTGLIAAAAAALLVVGVTAPFVDRPADIAAASEIVREVKDAARALTSYTATFTITEHNWHPDVDVRRFKATVWFEAPERFRLQVRDLTTYPDPQRWPRNDVDLVASPRAWWIEEPFSCPVEALPDCAVEADEQQRSIVNRGPFDGTTALPTDIVVPVETISAATDFQVIRTERVLGRRAHRIELTYRQALPLIGALQPGGSWRPFHPLDKVELWIDSSTSVPLRYRVIAGSFSERVRWSETNFVFDEPGEVLLDVEATSFGARDLQPGRFQVPRSGTRIDAGFTPGSFAVLGEGRAPSYRAGLEPYRAGTSPRGIVLSYDDGLKWLRLTYERGAGAAPADPAVADEIELEPRSFAYYRPADESLRRTVDIFGRRLQIHIESNLARDPLIDVARSLAVRGQRIEPPGSGTRVGARFFATRAWALAPTYLPAGYDARPSAAVLYESNAQKSLVAYHRNPEAEYDGFGIRITQRTGASLPPSSESFLPVNIHGVRARWSAERSEIEWVDGGIYRAVRAPSFDLATVVEIARGLK